MITVDGMDWDYKKNSQLKYYELRENPEYKIYYLKNDKIWAFGKGDKHLGAGDTRKEAMAKAYRHITECGYN